MVNRSDPNIPWKLLSRHIDVIRRQEPGVQINRLVVPDRNVVLVVQDPPFFREQIVLNVSFPKFCEGNEATDSLMRAD